MTEIAVSPKRRPASRSPLTAYLSAYVIAIVVLVALCVNAGQVGGGAYRLSASVIALIAFVIVFNPYSRDLLSPLKLAAAFYGLSFGLGPLLVGPSGAFANWVSGQPVYKSIDLAAVVALFGFLSMLIGYALVRKRPSGKARKARSIDARNWVRVGVGVYVVGLLSYLILVVMSGGFVYFLTYTGARANIFGDVFGGFYWGAFFMTAGLSLLGAVWGERHPLRVLGLAFVTGALFAVLLGRDAAISQIFVALVAIHYKRRPLTPKLVGMIALGLLLFASVFGFYRAADSESEGRESFGVLVSAFYSNAEQELLATIDRDIEKLDALAIIYRYEDTGGELLAGKTLLNWVGPVNRLLLGGALETIAAGPFLYGIINPYARGAPTGVIPSLPGELYLNFAVAGVIVGMVLFGLLLGLMRRFFLAGYSSPLRLALYAYPLWIVPKMVIDGTHLLTKVAAVIVAIGIAALLLKILGSTRMPRLAKRKGGKDGRPGRRVIADV